MNMFSIYSQNDVRGVKWGCTMEDVINSEYPLKPIIEKNEITFENVNLGEKVFSKLQYVFTNGRLSELTYSVYGSSQYNNGIGTCQYQVPIYYKYIFTKFIFDTLTSKGYKCDTGWHFDYVGIDNEKYFDEFHRLKEETGLHNNCFLDEKTLKKIDEIGKEIKSSRVGFSLENPRTEIHLSFNNPLNDEEIHCNSKIFG